jgi:UDP-glucose 6-dehydrogenase
MKVAIIGQGYVGLTISSFAAEFYDVVGFDSNRKVVDQLNNLIKNIQEAQCASNMSRHKDSDTKILFCFWFSIAEK